MNRLLLKFCLPLFAVLLAGCDPDKLVVWSPDGSAAAVIGADGLYLSDARGKLTELLIPRAVAAAWMPDSKRLLVATVIENLTWDHLAEFSAFAGLPNPERNPRIIQRANRLTERALAFNGSFKEFIEARDKDADSPHLELTAAWLYIRQHNADAWRKKFGPEFEEALKEPVNGVTLKLYTLAGSKLTEGPTLAVSLAPFYDIRPSPQGDAIAFIAAGEHDAHALYLAPASGQRPPTLIADLTGRFADWSPDGNYLVYSRANAPRPTDDAVQLGSLRRRRGP